MWLTTFLNVLGLASPAFIAVVTLVYPALHRKWDQDSRGVTSEYSLLSDIFHDLPSCKIWVPEVASNRYHNYICWRCMSIHVNIKNYDGLPIDSILVPMWSTVNGGLPLLALPFFSVVYVDTDVSSNMLNMLCTESLNTELGLWLDWVRLVDHLHNAFMKRVTKSWKLWYGGRVECQIFWSCITIWLHYLLRWIAGIAELYI